MTRKEKLIEIGKRCESGDVSICDMSRCFGRLFNTYKGGMFSDALEGDITSAAKLEKELLPKGAHQSMWRTEDGQYGFNYEGEIYTLQAYSNEEPLARLAALCYALAELEA